MKNRYWRVYKPPLSRFGPLLVVLLLFAATDIRPATALGPPPPGGPYPYAPGQVLIGWQPESGPVPKGAPRKDFATDRTSADWQAASQTLEALTGLNVLEADPYHGIASLAVPPGQEEAEVKRLSALPWIQVAEPNYIAYAADTYPNDPDIGQQWNMRRVYAPAAWDVTMGSYSIVVAVVDSGIDLNHPEFAYRIVPGHDYVDGDNTPNDQSNHGTHVSGIVAAAANNALGVAGLASNVKILSLKVLDSTGAGYIGDIAEAIMDAADYGAQIINLSLQTLVQSDILHNAVIYAAGKGSLVVAAAGNYGSNGNPDIYPAKYAEVLAVAASDHGDNWAFYSGYKPYVALAAPGGMPADQIWSTVIGGYGYEYGTSMATPMVSAAAALVWTYLPAANRTQVADILKQTADKVGVYPYVNGRNDHFGYGRLNAARAVRWAYPPSLSPNPSAWQYFLLGGPAQRSSGQVTLVNPSDQPVSWQATVLQGANWLKLSPSSGSGTASFSKPGSLSFEVGPTLPPPGTYPGLIRVLYNNPQLSGFDIPAQLQVTSTLHRSFVPQTTSEYLGAHWYNPLPGGRALNIPDNDAVSVSLPFPMNFYGESHSSIWVSDNGVALFTLPAGAGSFKPADCMPSAALPNDALYVLWNDWGPELGGNVYAHQPDNDTFVITWYRVMRPGTSIPHSFQLVLTRDGRVLFQYGTVESPVQGTIGIENSDGTVAQQILCDSVGRQVRGGDALLMNPVVPW